MSEEVIRYGAGGIPYKGSVGPKSTETSTEDSTEEKEEDVKFEMKFVEDDTPLSDEQVVKKTKGKK